MNSTFITPSQYGLGIATDSFAFPYDTAFKECDGWTELKTPSNPQFVYGNCCLLGGVQLSSEVRAAKAQLLLSDNPERVVVAESELGISNILPTSSKICSDAVLRLALEGADTLNEIIDDKECGSIPRGLQYYWVAGKATLDRADAIMQFHKSHKEWSPFQEWRLRSHIDRLSTENAQTQTQTQSQCRCYLAAAEEQILAALFVYWKGSLASVQDLLVAKSGRRQGIGRKLILHTAAALSAEKISSLIAVADRSDGAEQFYLACGFELCGVQEWFNGGLISGMTT